VVSYGQEMPRFGLKPAGASLAEIEELYRRRAADFERVATAIVRDSDAARDVVQDAFVTLVRKRATFARKGSLDAWAWKSVVNAALNRQRTARRHITSRLIDQLAEQSSSEVEPSADDKRVLSGLAALPQKERLIVFLRYYADLDYDTIATTLGMSAGTVGSALHSAHRSLRVHLSTEVIQ
jgi:RNA polymerase sigma factor (sigma-70 family)